MLGARAMACITAGWGVVSMPTKRRLLPMSTVPAADGSSTIATPNCSISGVTPGRFLPLLAAR